MNLNFKLKRNIRENLIILLVSLFLFFLVFIKYKYIFLDYEYNIDGYFYTNNIKENLITGIVEYKDHPYSTNYFLVKNGLVVGNYKSYLDKNENEELENNNYISDTQFIEKVRQLLNKKDISIYYFSDYERVGYSINIFDKNIKSRNNELKRLKDYTKFSKEFLGLINVKQRQIRIEFNFGDNLVYIDNDSSFVFFYKDRKLE